LIKVAKVSLARGLPLAGEKSVSQAVKVAALLLPQAAGKPVFSCQAPRPLALLNAEAPPAKPAFYRGLTPVVGHLPVAVSVASRNCRDTKAVGYCPS
jgi:hypothetical protein